MVKKIKNFLKKIVKSSFFSSFVVFINKRYNIMNELKDKFELNEQIGRQIFKDKMSGLNVDFNFTQGKYDPYDVSWVADGKLRIAEIKYRHNYDSKYLEKNGFLIEKYKYDALMNEAKRLNAIPIYIVITSDHKLYWFNLVDYEPKWMEKEMPLTTSGNQKIIKKVVSFLNFVKKKFGNLNNNLYICNVN